MTARSDARRALDERLSAVLRRGADLGPARDERRISTGWAAVDAVLGGGLPVGGVHEWLGVADDGDETVARADWTPTICPLAHLAWRAMDAQPGGWAAWIGRQCFPFPALLTRSAGRDRRLLERSIFINARDAAARLWAMDAVLRSDAVRVVIADGSRLDMAATRRLQLLSTTKRVWVLLARPAWERGELSAAQTRWLARSTTTAVGPEKLFTPCWRIELLRCKGVLIDQITPVWTFEWRHAESALHLSAPLGGATRDATPTTDARRVCSA